MRKIKLAVIGVIAASAALSVNGASAQAPAARSPEALERVYACATVTGDEARLGCYDAAVGALKTAQTTGEITAIDKVQAKQLERESFGFSIPSLPTIAFPNLFGSNGEPQTDAIQSTIARLGGSAKPTFYLQNGQAWQSIDSEENRNARTGATVTIRRGFSDSFLMSVEAGGPALRVRRIQ